MSERQAFKVFYSWQADLPGSANRSLIEDALERAAKSLRADDSIQVEAVVDRDTAGASGSPDIAATIFQKIAAADAFVADVSFIAPPAVDAPERKRCPNPNVLLELGYALHRHGWARVLIVFNEHYGALGDLPFDLRGRRVIAYLSAPENSDRATPRRLLQERFQAELRTMMGEPVAAMRTPVLKAVEAVEGQTPARLGAVRAATRDVNSRLRSVAPELAKDALDSVAFESALDTATPVIANWLELCQAVASIGDHDATIEVFRGLEDVARGYYLESGFSGTFWAHQFDYWNQIGYELLLGLVALLLLERRFETLGDLLKTRLHIPNSPAGGNDQVTADYLNPKTNIHQTAWGQRHGHRWISPIGQLLKERYTRPPLSNIVGWPEIQAADLFLYLWGYSLASPKPSRSHWVPHAAVLSTEPPRFLVESIRVPRARTVAQALGLPGPEALRDLYVDRAERGLREDFHGAYQLSGLNFPGAHKIGSEP